MVKHLYLSIMPEALIVSNLTPEEFGTYYAVGSEGRTQGQAAFFELDETFRHPQFPLDESFARCVPHKDGKPKNSVYVAVYRVLEHISLTAVKRLYLTTKDGRTLEVDHSAKPPEDSPGLHLYHEVAPLHPLVVSTYGPAAFHDFLMRGARNLAVPALCWTELRLGELADDPEGGAVRDLPYENIDHLRNCLMQLKTKSVTTKIVDRLHPSAFSYRTIKSGIFFGTKDGIAVFPLPPENVLRDTDYHWWRSANL
jgi:hypothetical protein